MSKEKELILEAKHVTKKFPLTKGKELIANDDVSLKFYKGQTLGIVGESGCGKSTFMRMMVQLEQPTSGEILFKGKDITKGKNFGKTEEMYRWSSRIRLLPLTQR